MNLELTTDMDLVRRIMTEPDIWARCSDDGINQDDWYPAYDGMSAWMLCVEDKEVIGVILVHNDTTASLKMHPYLRKEHHQLGRVMMRTFYDWVLDNTTTEINKINVTIPSNQIKVLNFVKKLGYKHEGINRDSIRKDGKLLSQVNLGITRREIEDYLNVFSALKKTA